MGHLVYCAWYWGDFTGSNLKTTTNPQPQAKSFPPGPDSNHLCATASSFSRGNSPQATVPSPPRDYYARDAQHETSPANTRAYEPQNEPGTACWDACSALLRNTLCVPLVLAGEFDSEELHMLHRGHGKGLSSEPTMCLDALSRTPQRTGQYAHHLPNAAFPMQRAHPTAPRASESGSTVALVRTTVPRWIDQDAWT